MSAIIPVPEMYITVCQWHNMHEGGVRITIADQEFVLTEFHFNNWNFMDPSIGFVNEFQDYFPSVVIGVECKTCEHCSKLLQTTLDTEIVNAQGVPPTS